MVLVLRWATSAVAPEVISGRRKPGALSTILIADYLVDTSSR